MQSQNIGLIQTLFQSRLTTIEHLIKHRTDFQSLAALIPN